MILWHITAVGAIGVAGRDNVLTANRRGDAAPTGEFN